MDFDGLKEGEAVEFEVERGEQGLRATTVRPHSQNGNELDEVQP